MTGLKTVEAPVRRHTLAVLVSLEMGWLGFDRFYLGKIGTGMLKALTLGGFLIWWLVDIYLVFAGSMRDARGRTAGAETERNLATALGFSIWGGVFGFDRLYLGHRELALLKFLTLGGALVWWVMDLVLLLTGKLTDDQGKSLLVS